MKRKNIFPELKIDLKSLEVIKNDETMILNDEVLKEFNLQVDKTKIDNFGDINFVSIFEE